MALQAKIGHDGGHDAGLGERPSACQLLRDNRHQLIAVDQMALFIDDQHAVGVAVEGDADVGAHFAHLARPGLRVRSSRRRD